MVETKRRDFLKMGVMTGAAAVVDPEGTLSQQPYAAAAKAPDPSRPWEAFPFTQIDYSQWPKPKAEDAGILSYHLTPPEALKLMKYKIDNWILDNKKVLGNLKDNHGIESNGFYIGIAKFGVMKPFYENVVAEFGKPQPWDPPGSNDMTVANVMDKFWRRMSMHVLKDDIEVQCRRKQGKGLGITLGKSYPLEIKMLGPAEQWRGHVPFDPARVNCEDEATMENIARRMQQLDLPKIMHSIGVTDDIFTVTADDLTKAGIIRDKKKQEANWSKRITTPPVDSYQHTP